MKNDNASERALALVNGIVDVLQWADHAPTSPVDVVLPPKLRREFRRRAARLRMGKIQPRYKNLHTAEQLADLCERTAERDDILDQAFQDFRRLVSELDRLLLGNDPEVEATLEAHLLETKRLAEEHGPGSEAAERFAQLAVLARSGMERRTRKRRQKTPARRGFHPAPDPSVELRERMSAMEPLPSPPAGETVIAIPPEGMDSGRGRLFASIGIGEWKWIGSFERGHQKVSTAGVMPDGKHLFVVVEGAGYIIDARSRTLVETIGTDIAGAILNEPPTMLVVDHDGVSLEAFGKSGRLWKTGAISVGGFRQLGITPWALLGQARHPRRSGWSRFFVKLATGEGAFLDGKS